MRNWESCDKGTNQRFHGDLFKSRNKYIKITHYIFPLWRPGFCVLLLEEPIQPSCMSPVTLLCTSGTLNKIQINAVETSNIVMSGYPLPRPLLCFTVDIILQIESCNAGSRWSLHSHCLQWLLVSVNFIASL